jgi:PAS domain S-box-containing protein
MVTRTKKASERTQDASGKSEKRFRALLEHSYDAVVLTTAEGKTIYASPAIERVIGYTPEEYMQLNGAELIHADDLAEEIAFFRHILQKPGLTFPPHQTRLQDKTGSWRWIEYTATNLLHDPDVSALVFNFRDITERKQAEKALAERAHQQAVVAKIGQQALAGVDLQLLMDTTANLLAETLEVEITSVLELMPDEKTWHLRAGRGWGEELGKTTIAPGKQSQAGYTLASKKPVIVTDYSQEKRFAKHPWLVKQNVVSSLSVIIAGETKPFGVLSLHTRKQRIFTNDDLSFVQAIATILALTIERTRADEELQKHLSLVNGIIEQTEDIIFVKDTPGRYILVNPQTESLFQKPKEEILGKTAGELFPREIAQNLEEVDQRIMQTKKAEVVEEQVTSASGEIRTYLSTKGVYFDGKGNVAGLIGISRDITERKEAEKRKDEFISMASHELKTPVTSLKGFTAILERRFLKEGDEQALTYLGKIDRQVNKLTKLINDLLDISRIQMGKLDYREERFELSCLIQEIIENMQGTTSTHQLFLEEQALSQVFGDRDRIGQVLINLLANAIKYSPQADKVIVRLTTDQNNAIVSVQDFGTGIAKEHHHRIFERFYQVTNAEGQAYPGLGIGLYISCEIIKRHGGQIWVESKKGEGTTFYFTLPLIA